MISIACCKNCTGIRFRRAHFRLPDEFNSETDWKNLHGHVSFRVRGRREHEDVVAIGGIRGKPDSIGTFRLGQWHTCTRIGFGGLDRPTGIGTPSPLSRALVSGHAFTLNQDRVGAEGTQVRKNWRIIGQILIGANLSAGSPRTAATRGQTDQNRAKVNFQTGQVRTDPGRARLDRLLFPAGTRAALHRTGKEAVMKILVAYDGSPAADAAIDLILEQPWPGGTQVRVVTVLDTPMFYPMANGIEVYPPLSEKVRQAMRENAYRSVQAAVEKLKAKPGILPSYELREGDVKRALLEAIREWGSDLVIVGSHGKGALGRLFLGSVSHALVTHAPCNVEVVRPAGAAA